MPYITQSSYQTRWPFTNAHVNTIYPNLFRRLPALSYERETMDTPDGDFLDLDWLRSDNEQLIIGLHGLEGDTERPYLKGIFHYFNQRSWDVLGVNFRSCSGRLNNRLRMYNMGESHDLALVLQHALKQDYKTIVLTGFSLGGGVVLKFMGESGRYLPQEVKGAVAFSVPIHLTSANVAIARRQNFIYMHRFMRTLNAKAKDKATQFPGYLKISKKMPRDFQGFDSTYTAPIHGYAGAEDYWHSCSSLHFLPNVDRPTLIVNAADDTFLAPPCFPRVFADSHPYVHLEVPKYGGHCGFYGAARDGSYWHERRAYDFISSQLKL